MTSLIVRLSLAASVLLTVLSPNPAAAYCRMTTMSGAQIGDAPCVEEGEPLFWRNTCLSYAIDSRGSQSMSNEDIEEAVDLAFETWENADCGGEPPNLVFTSVGPSMCKRPEFNDSGNVNTVAFLDPWRDPCGGDFEPLAFAVTVLWRNGESGEIFDADIMINDEPATRNSAGGPYANCPMTGCEPGTAAAPGPADLRSIVTHEIGHFIGIGHSDVVTATMFSMADRESVEKRSLDQDDIDAVCDIYPPGNLEQSCNPTPIGGLRLDCEIDDNGNPFICDEPGSPPGSNGGCNASGAPQRHLPWLITLGGVLFGITVLRRRSRRRAARS